MKVITKETEDLMWEAEAGLSENDALNNRGVSLQFLWDCSKNNSNFALIGMSHYKKTKLLIKVIEISKSQKCTHRMKYYNFALDFI